MKDDKYINEGRNENMFYMGLAIKWNGLPSLRHGGNIEFNILKRVFIVKDGFPNNKLYTKYVIY